MNEDGKEQKNKNRIIKFFSKWDKVITGTASILATVGIFLTFYQIREAKIQVRANKSYQFHKDGRELFSTLSPEIKRIIRGNNLQKQYDEQMLKKAESKIHEILMYYAALFKQNEYGNIDEGPWSDISKEACNFIRLEKVRAFWQKKIVKSKSWNPKFIQFGCFCLQQGGDDGNYI